MRDILTALAGAVILILVAALAAPPFIDWSGQRALIDRTLSASLGVPVRSDGRIAVRLLPFPRLRLDRVKVGGRIDRPSLDVQLVKAELALMPLLKGEFRFTETRIGRAEMKLPVTEGDAIVLPGGLARAMAQRDLVIDDLRIQQALVTTIVPATGRTDQFYAEGLRLKAPSLNGPWLVEGSSRGIPFRLSSGAIAADGASVKITGGGEAKPRFEAEARIALKALDREADAAAMASGKPRVLVPEAEGSARLVVGMTNQAAGAGLPFTFAGKFKARGGNVRFDEVTAEVDPGGQAARLSGTGRIDLRGWRAELDLETRRLNLDGLIFSSAGQALLTRGLGSEAPALPLTLDLDLRLESLALGFEDWSDLRFSGRFDPGEGLTLKHFSGTAPGATRVEASGDIALPPNPRFTGRVAASAARSDGIGRYLRRLGLEAPGLALLDGRFLQASGDIDAIAADLSLRNLNLALGEARVTGNARSVRAEPGARGRFEAQLKAQGVDLAELPPLDGALNGLERTDLSLTIEARDLRYGATGGTRSGGGSVAASIQSNGASLVVDSLDIRNLAGTDATLSGRIAPDGAGTIAGRIAAPSAAPLLGLLDRAGFAETALVPAVFRAGALALDVTLERQPGDAQTLRLTAKGKAAESTLDASLRARAGRIEGLEAILATPRTGTWFARDDIPGLRQPASLTLAASRPAAGDPAAPLSLTAEGTLAGLSLKTTQPILIDDASKPPRSGALRAASADLTPFLTLAGAAAIAAPVPAEFSIGLSRPSPAGGARADIGGRLAGSEIAASLDRAGDGRVSGTVTLGSLSLPALAGAAVVPPAPGSAADEAGWSKARFAKPALLPRTDLAIKAGRLDLGRGFVASETRFDLALDGEALLLKDFSGRFGGGTLAGSTTIARHGTMASVSGEGALQGASITSIMGESALRGRLSASLRYSGTGDSAAALLGNLGGSGEITLSELVVPGGDPAAIDRALARALGQDDPLREGQLETLLSDELSAAPLAAKGPVSTTATLVGGALRTGPIELDLGASRWSGSVALDLRRRQLEARGTLTSMSAPKGWSGGKPSVQLGFGGPLAAPQRLLDSGPVANGLAALVLQRELEKIEQFEADQVERQRRRARIEMDKARAAALKAAAEKAAAEKAAAERAVEEAARAARLRAQQAAAEEARRARERREAEEAARRARIEEEASQNAAPLAIRPPDR